MSLLLADSIGKVPKCRATNFPQKDKNKRQSSIDVVSGPPPKSPVSSSQDDVVPHIIIRLSHLQLGKFVSRPAKRLLQHGVIPESSQTRARESALQESMGPASCGLATMESGNGILCRT